ncbi:MAG: UTP--glucose-1-phosphate uridylyltransferase [Lachnospiraceae bacterium]
MDYSQALKKAEEYGQQHILQYFHELNKAEQEALLNQIEETDFAVTKLCNNKDQCVKKGKITPLKAMELPQIQEKQEDYRKTGLAAIRAGKVGAVLLAGGMGTRLGSDDAKGMYNIGITKDVYIFERLIMNLMKVVAEAGCFVPLFVMTSDKNHDATTRFLKEHDYFGYDRDSVYFFRQDMAPAADYNGRIYMESKSRMSTSPNGNGGWYISLCHAGLRDVILQKGIEWLNVFAVDNVLQQIADPVFTGAVIDRDCAVGSKVVRKNAPDEKVGVMCLEDGRPSIVEYYELSDEMRDAKDEKGDPAYNFGVILNYLFKESELHKIMDRKLPLHIVEKKIPYMNENGELINPEEPNGYKFEQLVLDMIHEMDSCLPFEVVREKEFAPIKNKTGVDSVESARELLKQNGIDL